MPKKELVLAIHRWVQDSRTLPAAYAISLGVLIGYGAFCLNDSFYGLVAGYLGGSVFAVVIMWLMGGYSQHNG